MPCSCHVHVRCKDFHGIFIHLLVCRFSLPDINLWVGRLFYWHFPFFGKMFNFSFHFILYKQRRVIQRFFLIKNLSILWWCPIQLFFFFHTYLNFSILTSTAKFCARHDVERMKNKINNIAKNAINIFW